MNWPESVTINEVGLRDGLQLEKKILSVEEKERLTHQLLEANVQKLEFGSFVHPKLVPQMKNSGELFELIKEIPGKDFMALIPNQKGVEIAASYGVRHVNFVLSASETHNQQNVRQTTDQSLERYKEIKQFCDLHGIKVDVSISTTFGCPFEGEIPLSRIHWILQEISEYGANTITLADTTGMANPKQVYELTSNLLEKYPQLHFSLHFHNTRGMGLSNIIAGFQAGVRSFDAALGGLGGCPFAPGATGNVCTEDVVHMLHAMGIKTGIDLDRLIEASTLLQRLIGHELPSSVLKAGKFDRKYKVPST